MSGLLWRQYKFLIGSLVVLIVSMIIVSQIHTDYIAYVKTSGESANIGMSFIVKWLSWIGLIISFLYANHIANKRKEKIKAQQPSKSLKQILSFKSKTDPSAKKTDAVKLTRESGDDPFEHLRTKEKLRSYADLIIDKHNDSSKN